MFGKQKNSNIKESDNNQAIPTKEDLRNLSRAYENLQNTLPKDYRDDYHWGNELPSVYTEVMSIMERNNSDVLDALRKTSSESRGRGFKEASGNLLREYIEVVKQQSQIEGKGQLLDPKVQAQFIETIKANPLFRKSILDALGLSQNNTKPVLGEHTSGVVDKGNKTGKEK